MYFFLFTIVQSMRESIKHIYKKMLLILTCSQMFFFLVCILLNQIPAPQMNADDFLQTVFLRVQYQHQMSNYTDIIW